MERNKLILLCVCVVVVVFVACSSFFVLNSSVGTSLSTSGLSVNQGDNFTITLSDDQGNNLSNKTINMTLSNGNQSKDYNFTTDSNGVVSLPVNLPAGNYTVNCTFMGDDDYGNSSISQNLLVNGTNEILSSNSKGSGSSLGGSSDSGSNDLDGYVWAYQYNTYIKQYTTSDGIEHIDGLDGQRETYNPETGENIYSTPDGQVSVDYYK